MTIIRRRRRRWRITKQDLDSGEISNDDELRRIKCEVERESSEGNESGIVYVCLRERERKVWEEWVIIECEAKRKVGRI